MRKLATAYFEQDKSPFLMLKATSHFYNAVMNMTTRAFMEEAGFPVNSGFGASVDGAGSHSCNESFKAEDEHLLAIS